MPACQEPATSTQELTHMFAAFAKQQEQFQQQQLQTLQRHEQAIRRQEQAMNTVLLDRPTGR